MGGAGRGCLGVALDPLRRGRFGSLALALFALVGVANAVLDVAVFTALQRALPSDAIGRGLGVLETVALVGLGLGAALAPAALAVTDVHGVFLGAGLFLVAAAAAGWRAAALLDHRLPVPGPEVSVLRGLPIFGPLPLVTVEYLATRSRRPASMTVRWSSAKASPAPSSTSSSRAKRSPR